MEYAAVIAAIVSAVTSLVAAGKDNEAQRLLERTAAEYGPEILPELEKAIAKTAGKSAFEGMSEDPLGRDTQRDVDSELADIYDSGGRTAEDEAAYDVARRSVSQRAASQAGNIAMSAAQRGQTGSGLSAVLASQSGQDELEALAGLNAEVAASGRQRALQALQARAGNAANMRSQDWNVKSEGATAVDLMNRFNASQEQTTNMYNLGLPQQQFNNNIVRLSAQTGANNNVATGLNNQAAGIRQEGAGVANATLSTGQAWDWAQDPKKKKKDD